jgi:diacylglycerol O-acyltransferase
MRRLSGSDAVFLATETSTGHMHIGGLTILDPTDAPGFSYQTLLDTVRERIPLAPKFTWRLKEVPLGLDNPVWVDDPGFDAANHMHRIGVPAPGGPRELATVVGDIMSHPIDRGRPLWELWYIEGLAGGQVALAMKVHHAMVDGISGMGLTELLLDLEPNPAPRALPEPVSADGPARSVSDVELLGRAGLRIMTAPVRYGRYAAQAARRGIAMVPFATRREVVSPMDAPRTPWNGDLSPRRALAFSSVPLDDVKKIREHFDVKVNDVILALTAGALRRYLDKYDVLPDKPLISAVPISTRAAGDNDPTNKVANMFVSLATNIDDPVERLQTIYRSTQSSKAMTTAIRAHDIQALGDTASPMVLNLASRTIVATNIMRRLPMACNVVVSNVPGPPIPLYICGARLTHMYATGPFLLGMGLNVTVISYLDDVDFGFHGDPEKIEDLWFMAEGIPEALEELLAALPQ